MKTLFLPNTAVLHGFSLVEVLSWKRFNATRETRVACACNFGIPPQPHHSTACIFLISICCSCFSTFMAMLQVSLLLYSTSKALTVSDFRYDDGEFRVNWRLQYLVFVRPFFVSGSSSSPFLCWSPSRSERAAKGEQVPSVLERTCSPLLTRYEVLLVYLKFCCILKKCKALQLSWCCLPYFFLFYHVE